jgi:formylglycine-generating enzyme required for sulfatase activity
LEQERLQKLREEEEKGPLHNKLLVAASVLVILLLGYWMIAPGSNDSSNIPDTTQSTPAAIAVTASPAPIITSTNDKKTITNSIGMEFVLIPAGEFDMGSPSSEVDRYTDEGPVHRVKLSSAFYMGKYEVTQKQWREVMGTNLSSFTGDDLPVESVSWDDVQQFITKLNAKEGTTMYRLPSEAE